MKFQEIERRAQKAVNERNEMEKKENGMFHI
jgi:hypothetical protein